MKTILKMITTITLLLTILVPIIYFLIYPNYNSLIGPIKRINIQRSAEEITFQFLTEVSPSRDRVLGTSDTTTTERSIEETLSSSLILDDHILENLNSKLIINSIEAEGKIFEGADPKTMDRGFWHFPVSQMPGEKGNTVIIGHRYAKLPPERDTFFNLDKVRVGDRITIEQENNKFTYVVTETKIVEKNDISILDNYNDYRLTLITCTPLWTADQRLVIIGKLDKLYQNT
jgi:LPXTG-site transpeptidase (sortase) family protein